jgi:hypothetical protein
VEEEEVIIIPFRYGSSGTCGRRDQSHRVFDTIRSEPLHTPFEDLDHFVTITQNEFSSGSRDAMSVCLEQLSKLNQAFQKR